MTLTFGSLFAGIGGFDLGFERAGMQCKWQVEIDPYARRVLEKHWPNVRRHDDVRTFPTEPIDQWKVDVICGGFPCQDISYAGKGAGINGSRSGLWSEFARIIGILRPRFAVLENSPAILTRGISRILGDLAEVGYSAEWDCIPACAIGASHIRDRFFLVADVDNEGNRIWREKAFFTDADNESESGMSEHGEEWYRLPSSSGEAFALPEPDVGRMAYGIPSRVDRIRGLGNAVVPQVAEWIGRRILDAAKF